MRREELARVGDRMNVCGMCVYGVIGIDVCARCGCGFVVDIVALWARKPAPGAKFAARPRTRKAKVAALAPKKYRTARAQQPREG